jgi:sporulation protein YlmC with PRC-barrel domain
MLQLSASLIANKSVLSLRTGAPVANILNPIVNPNNFKIEGFFCEDKFNKTRLVLLCQDIRDIVPNGYIVNDHDVLVEPTELVRLKEILQINYEVINKQVITIDKEKVGKVNDYAVETSSMYIQKIYVSQSIMKSFTGGNLSIDRNQINEVTPNQIIINELMEKAPLAAAASAG